MTFKHALLIMAAAAVSIVWIGQFTDIDMRLAQAMYHRDIAAFPMRHAWLAESFSHGYMKRLLVLLGGAVCIMAAFDTARPIATLGGRKRRCLRLVALSALLVPLVTGILKRASSSHCPWDLADFGGAEAYVRLFDTAVRGAPGGHCMPGGHASGGLWFIALAAFWLPHQPRRAGGVFCAALAFGFWLGWMQQLRGAHFLTHTLWSMWVACAIVGVLYAALDASSRSTDAVPAAMPPNQ